ncbi:MAG: VTT domain-containing protein [Candidatus Competibacteraceae bacterium]|nr:VTT domain-containing protein [Candidatus Competibacteraceae bacterium]
MTTPLPATRRSLFFRFLGALAVVALLATLWLAWNYEAVLTWKRQAGPLSFFTVMVLLPAVGFPMTPFFVLAGATFGAGLGLLGSAVALALNLLLCHWISHSGLRPYLESLLGRTRYRLPDYRVEEGRGLRFTVLVRIAPGVPVFIKNYLVGLAGVSFRTYFGVSMLLTGVYGTGFVLLGESMLEHDLAEAALALTILIAAGTALGWWRKRFLSRWDTGEQRD